VLPPIARIPINGQAQAMVMMNREQWANDLARLRHQEVEWMMAGKKIENTSLSWYKGDPVTLTLRPLHQRVYRAEAIMPEEIIAAGNKSGLELTSIPALLATAYLFAIQGVLELDFSDIATVMRLEEIGFPLFRWLRKWYRDCVHLFGGEIFGVAEFVYGGEQMVIGDSQGRFYRESRTAITQANTMEHLLVWLIRQAFSWVEKYGEDNFQEQRGVMVYMSSITIYTAVAVGENNAWFRGRHAFATFIQAPVFKQLTSWYTLDEELGVCLLELAFWIVNGGNAITTARHLKAHTPTTYKEWADYRNTMLQCEFGEICMRGDLLAWLTHPGLTPFLIGAVVLNMDAGQIWTVLADKKLEIQDIREVGATYSQWRTWIRRNRNRIYLLHHKHMIECNRSRLERNWKWFKKWGWGWSVENRPTARLRGRGTLSRDNREWEKVTNLKGEMMLDIESRRNPVTGQDVPFLICWRWMRMGFDVPAYATEDCLYAEDENDDIVAKWWVKWEEWCNELGNKNGKPSWRVWAHNGTNYDYRLLLQAHHYKDVTMIGGATTYKAFILHGCIFADFCRIFSQSLDDLGTSWIGLPKDEPIKWDDLGDKWLPGGVWREKIHTYCRRDVDILHDIVREYMKMTRGMVRNRGGRAYGVFHEDIFTSAGLAYETWKTCYMAEVYQPLTEEQYTIVATTYFGGYTQVFGKGPYTNTFYYDRNSHYPAEMIHDMPNAIVEEVREMTPPELFSSKWIDDTVHIYLLLVTWNITDPGVHWNTMGYRLDNGEVVYLRRNETPVWKWACEIRDYHNAIVSGYIQFSRTRPFAEYINDMYARRLAAKREPNAAKVAFYKLLMNSLYGKFGQKKYNRQIVGTPIELWTFIKSNPTKRIVSARQLKDYMYVMDFEEKTASDCQYYIHWASYITASARGNLGNMLDAYTIYCDTDSVIRTEPMCPRFIDANTLGMWKNEGEVARCLFIAPKMYYIEYKNGKGVIKCKGINDGQWLNNFERWEDGTILTDEKIRVPGNIQFRKNCGAIVVCQVEKVIRTRQFKRVWYNNFKSDLLPDLQYFLDQREEMKRTIEPKEAFKMKTPQWRKMTPSDIELDRQIMGPEIEENIDTVIGRWLGEHRFAMTPSDKRAIIESYMLRI
jgi:hypothetical protein